MTNSIRIIIILVLILTFGSCSVEKRIYRKGYHVVWNHNRADDSKRKEVIKTIKPLEEEIPTEVVVSANKEIIPLKPKPTLLLKDTCGDKLLLQNAEELIVKIIEIGEHVIKYKRCDNPDGPLYSINKNKVALITFANGLKEVVIQETPKVEAKEKSIDEDSRKINIVGLASFYCSTFGILLLFGPIVSMPLTIISAYQFRRHPDKYKNKWMPKAATIINLVFWFYIAFMLWVLTSVPGTPFGPYMIAAAIFALLGIVSICTLTMFRRK